MHTDRVPAQYPPLAQGADRLYNLYFQLGKSTLDTVALDNLHRIAGLLGRPENRDGSILLIGHTDNTGANHQANLDLSIARAKTVREKLVSRGVKVLLATGFGQELPIEPNHTAEGREHNLRVEVWIRRHT